MLSSSPVLFLLQRYHLLQEMSSSPFGTTYLAHDDQESTLVSITIIPKAATATLRSFAARFALLKNILPTIEHAHLVSVVAMQQTQDTYYLIKQTSQSAHNPWQDLDSYLKNTPHPRLEFLESLFENITQALAHLEQVPFHYSSQGFAFDRLCPKNIYLEFDSSLAEEKQIPHARLDIFFETFLFWEDLPDAALQRQMLQSSMQNNELFVEESFASFSTRQGHYSTTSTTQYAFGALCYQLLTGRIPKGIYTVPSHVRTDLNPLWDEIITNCLCAIYSRKYDSMSAIAAQLKNALSNTTTTTSIEPLQKAARVTPAGMALIELEGKAELGADDGPIIEQPRFRARITPFFIDIFPITCKQFEEFLPSYERSIYANKDNSPATLISWNMAKAYCRWRSQKEGLPPDTYRLPTEYEWEAAVRGCNGEQFPWGTALKSTLIHCNQLTTKGTVPVDQHLAGRFGLYSILGNTWEWTESHFKPHPFSKNAIKEHSAHLYTVKGGCWFTPEKTCRASLRAAFSSHERKGNIGFRCARSLPATEHLI